MANIAATLTFSECVENHAGMEMIGKKQTAGFTRHNLEHMKHRFIGMGGKPQIYDMACGNETASVLVLRGGVDLLTGGKADALFEETLAQKFDTTFKNVRRSKPGAPCVQNKHGRHNNCYADFAQKPEIAEGKGTVIDFVTCPIISELRKNLPLIVGYMGEGIYAETNKYYDVDKAQVGIGFHGDTERSIVIGARLGVASEKMPIRFQWYTRSKPCSEETVIPLGHGDMYIMEYKATGWDWMKSSKITLRHGSGRKAKVRTDVNSF